MLNRATGTAAMVLIAALVAVSSTSAIGQGGKQPEATTWEDLARIKRGEGENSPPVADTPEPSIPDANIADSATPAANTSAANPPATHKQKAVAKKNSTQPAAAEYSESPAADAVLTHPIVYTRVARTRGRHDVILRDGSKFVLESPDIWDTLPDSQKVFGDFNAPGQLVLRNTDGSERILYDCFTPKKPCVPLDPVVSFDGRKILFSVYRGKYIKNASSNGTTLPNERLAAPTEARLYVVDVKTGAVTALAHSPGVFDVSPAWLPNGDILFASSRANIREPWLDRITPNNRPDPQLYIADADGSNAVNIAPHEVTTAMHPYVLQSGRVAYSSQWLSHNLAYGSTNGGINWPGTLDNMWLVMDMDIRGGDMNALLGAHSVAFTAATGRRKTKKALHFLGQRNNGDICVSNYYRANNLGLGDVVCWQPEPVGIEGQLPNFRPRNIYDVAVWAQSNDSPSFQQDGIFLGKIGYPEGMPDNQLLLTLGRGFCTQVSGTVQSLQKRASGQPQKRACDVGLYLTTTIPSTSLSDLSLVVDHPDWHEFAARVVAPRKVASPPLSMTGDGSCQLTSSDAGSAETSPARPYKFNANYRTTANNGGEIDGLDHSELAGIRFWEVVPNTEHKRTFKNSIGNRLRLLGDTSLLADKSFKVALPCDKPFLMAGIDKEGRVIKRDQVPQSLRPGEKRICMGCHLHSQKGRPYEQSLAFAANATPLLMSSLVPTYEKDIKPIFRKHCMDCHSQDLPLMDYNKLVWDHFQLAVPEDKRIQTSNAKDQRRRWGLHRPYTSKYVNTMFARESLLYWKAANQRTDGRSDATYPNDIDFGPDHPTSITAAELKILAEWLDSGATSTSAK